MLSRDACLAFASLLALSGVCRADPPPILDSDDSSRIVSLTKSAAADSDAQSAAKLHWELVEIRKMFAAESVAATRAGWFKKASRRPGPSLVDRRIREEIRRDMAFAAHAIDNIGLRDVIRDELAGSGTNPQTHGAGGPRVRSP